MVNIKTYISIALLFFIFISFSNDAYSAQNNNIKVEQKEYEPKNVKELFKSFYKSTGVYEFLNPIEGKLGPEKLKPMSKFSQSFGRILMIMICILLFYLAISKNFEPLLLLPNGFLGILYSLGVQNGLFPIIIFMGVGAMTDFGPLIANPKTALLGAAAQFGIFGSLVGAVFLSQNTSIIDFSLQDSAAISIIGGADGPTAIFIASRLAPDLLGAIAVAAYSYMALVPIIQPPIMRALTSEDERKIKMVQLRKVNKLEKIFFPITLLILCILVLPDATPLVGALCFGNFLKESGAVDRLSDTMQNSLINIVTIFLGLAVGSKLAAEKFLVPETLGIIIIGLVAFSLGTATGVLMGKLLNKLSKDPINPLIGAAGVSAVPMAARVVSKVGNEEDSSNILLMHAMGPNVSGVIGSAVAAGVLISIFA